MAAYLARRLQLQRAVRHETCEERHEPEALQLQQLQQLLVEIVAWLSVRDAFLALPSTSRQLQQAYQEVKMHIRSSDVLEDRTMGLMASKWVWRGVTSPKRQQSDAKMLQNASKCMTSLSSLSEFLVPRTRRAVAHEISSRGQSSPQRT